MLGNLVVAVLLFVQTNVFVLNALALILMLFVVALAYMLGKAIGRQEYVAFAKLELFQVVMSALILMFGLGAVTFFEALLTEWAGCDSSLPDCTTEKIAINYIETLLYDPTYGAIPKAYELKRMNLLGEAISAFGQRVSYPGWGVKKGIELNRALGGVMLSFTNALYMPFQLFVPSLYLQRYIIDFIGLASLQIILPIGIFLRTIPPTRPGGTFLIALGLSLKTVFLFTYVMHYVTVVKFIAPIFTEIEYVVPNPQGTSSNPNDPVLPQSYLMDDSKKLGELTRAYRDIRATGLGGWITRVGNTFNDFLSASGSIVDKLPDELLTPQAMLGGYSVFSSMKDVMITVAKAQGDKGFGGIQGALARPFIFVRNISLVVWVGGIGFGLYTLVPLLYILLPTTLSSLSWLVLQGIFLPALSFVITSTFIQSFYKYLSNVTS